MAYLDIIKINHWLNARKLTINLFKVKKFNLYKKLKKNKNFKCSDNEINYLLKNLNVNKSDLILKKTLPEYIFKTKNKFSQLKDRLKEMEFIFIIIIHYLVPPDSKLQLY